MITLPVKGTANQSGHDEQEEGKIITHNVLQGDEKRLETKKETEIQRYRDTHAHTHTHTYTNTHTHTHTHTNERAQACTHKEQLRDGGE